jgi:uncharacterized protein YecE (DUF72 family)
MSWKMRAISRFFIRGNRGAVSLIPFSVQDSRRNYIVPWAHEEAMIRVGTCGFPLSRSVLYRTLDMVEVQRTFYRPPKVETARRWRQEAPPGFRFAVKAWQLITHEPSSPTYRRLGMEILKDDKRYGHFRPTKEVFEAWETTEEICRALRAVAIVFQCPPSFGESEENVANMREFFPSISHGWVLCWEPRGEWSADTVRRLCDSLGLVHCVDPFVYDSVTRDRAYFRLHGSPPGPRRYYYTYTDGDLQRLRKMCGDYGDVDVLFNNVTMYDDAVRFREALGV